MFEEKDYLIVLTKKKINIAIEEHLLSFKWKKESDQLYSGYGFSIEILYNDEEKKIIEIFGCDWWGNILSSKKKIIGFFLTLGVKNILNRIIAIIKKIDENAIIYHYYKRKKGIY